MAHQLTLLISQAELAETVQRLAQDLDRDYGDRSPIVVGILKGSFVFLADLIRAMHTPIQRVELIQLSSYRSATSSSGTVKTLMNVSEDLLTGQDVLLVEDIVDTGLSTRTALQLLNAQQPRSLKLCSLLDKPDRRSIPVTIDYLGLTVPNRFIVGYGIDMNEQYRQLSGIYAVDDVP